MRDVVLEHAAVGRWLERETPGPEAVLGHVLSTGHGRSWADRWPDPSVLLTETGGNYLLLGDPRSVDPDALRPLVRGFLAAPSEFVPVLTTAFPDRVVWDRVVYRLPPDRALARPAVEAEVRALTPDDADAVAGLGDEIAWIVTEPEHRGRGLATACASAWCEAVRARGRVPSWTTSPDNLGSLRIPEWLGFELVRRDALHVVGVEVPR